MPKCLRYPVHFQQNAGLSLSVSEGGVGEAGAEAQEAPLEATGFLRHALGVILQKELSLRAIPVILLHGIVVFWETEAGTRSDK